MDALLFLGSKMTLASFHACGHTHSFRLWLKIYKIVVAIQSATILNSFQSRLSIPGGLSLLMNNKPLLSINNDKAPGIDNLDGKLLRMVADCIATPICFIFNQSLNEYGSTGVEGS